MKFLSLSMVAVALWSIATVSLAFAPKPVTTSFAGRALGTISRLEWDTAQRGRLRSLLQINSRNDDNNDDDDEKDDEMATANRISPQMAGNIRLLVGGPLVVYSIAMGKLPAVSGFDTETQLLTILILAATDLLKLELAPALYFYFLLGSVTIGRVFLFEFLPNLLGPTLLIAGALAMVAGISEPKKNVPSTNAYAYVRHPIYAGLIAIAMGWSLTTHNPIRIAMSALLWYILSRKADDDEKLLKMGPKKEAYEIYEKKVRTKFIPLLWPESKSVFTPWLRTYDDY